MKAGGRITAYAAAAAVLVSCAVFVTHRWRSLREEVSAARAAAAALVVEADSLRSRTAVLSLSARLLAVSGDSAIRAMDSLRRELGIRDRRLEQLQYVSTEASRTDTVVLRDTVFRDPGFRLDTLLGDRWFSVELGLEWPSTVCVSPSYRSELYVVMSVRKEYVGGRKRFFLARWFQKKIGVPEADVREMNPYAAVVDTKFITVE